MLEIETVGVQAERDLVEAVKKMRERIREHGSSIGSYEARTRASLIDPVLYALGWDVGDPAQVTIEPRTESGRPDYALLGVAGKPVLLIEAKKLAVTREPLDQVVSYVVTENMRRDYKVQFCACTNGDVWKVFDVTSGPVLEIQISVDDAADCGFKLLGLWRKSLIDGSLRTAVKLPSTTPMRSADQVTTLDDSEEPAGDDAWTLANLKAEDEEPSSITFPGEDAKELHTQKDLLVSVAEYLVRTGSLTARNATLPSGPKRYITHSSPRHPSDKPFAGPVKLARRIHLETSNSFAQTIKYAQKLLEHYRPGAQLAGRVRLA